MVPSRRPDEVRNPCRSQCAGGARGVGAGRRRGLAAAEPVHVRWAQRPDGRWPSRRGVAIGSVRRRIHWRRHRVHHRLAQRRRPQRDRRNHSPGHRSLAPAGCARGRDGKYRPERRCSDRGLRLDVAAPSIAFLPRDRADPSRVQLSVADEGSGIASVAIEARRQGEDAWRTISVVGEHGSAYGATRRRRISRWDVRGSRARSRCRRQPADRRRSSGSVDPAAHTSGFAPFGRNAKADESAGRRWTRGRRSFGARVAIRGRRDQRVRRRSRERPGRGSERLAMPGVAWRPSRRSEPTRAARSRTRPRKEWRARFASNIPGRQQRELRAPK